MGACFAIIACAAKHVACGMCHMSHFCIGRSRTGRKEHYLIQWMPNLLLFRLEFAVVDVYCMQITASWTHVYIYKNYKFIACESQPVGRVVSAGSHSFRVPSWARAP